MSGRRTRLAEGVYQDRYGISGMVKVKGVQREERFPHDTSIDRIQAWRSRTRAELLEDAQDAGPTIPSRGTFADDVERFLKKITHRVAFQADRSHIKAWLEDLGALPRTKIRSAHVQAAIDGWTGKASARTIRHRRRVFRELYRILDGPHARPPLRGVSVPKIPDPIPVAVPWSTVQKVAKSLSRTHRIKQACGPSRKVVTVERQGSPKGHARFLVLATTGQRPAQVMRAQREDVDLKRRIWFVRPAKGGSAVTLPLDAEMVKAWKAFIKADAWGPFDTKSLGHLLRRHGWPKGVRPYALRSTLAIDMILGGADLSDVQAALGHKRIDTTRQHYASVQLARAKRALRLRKRGKLS
jgi:integrase